MNILRKPVGKYVIIIAGGLALVLLLSDLNVVKQRIMSQRVLTISGSIDPSLSLTLGSSYLASKDGFGCSSWSLFGGWQPRYTGDRRIAKVSGGHFEVSIPVPDRSGERCGYTLQGVSLGLAKQGTSPKRWLALFAYSDETRSNAFDFADPLNAYCTPISQAQDDWTCSRRPDAQTVLGYPTDHMPAEMTINFHVQTSVPYEIEH